MDVAIDLCYRHFDSAMFYFSEKVVGEAIKRGLKKNNLKREDIFVTSKVRIH